MDTTDQRLERLEDESAIRALTAAFADAATRNDKATLRELWTPDAEFAIGAPMGKTAVGVERIMDFFAELRDGREFFVQFVHSGVVSIDGDRATARWLVHEIARGGGGFYTNYGFFSDVVEKRDGAWRFRRRSYSYVYLDASPFAGDAYPLPAELAP